MQNKLFLKAADICELLEVKQTSAYLVRVPYIKNISQLCFANVKHFFTLWGCGRNPGPNEVINRRRSRTCIPTKTG